MVKLKIKDIKIPKMYCRLTVNPDTVELYMENINKLPPVTVNKNKILINGMHRIQAHKEKGKTEIEAEIVDIPDRLVFIESIKRNRTQGKQLTKYDRQHSAVILYQQGITDLHEVADLLDVHYDSTVRWTRHIRKIKTEKRNAEILALARKGKTQKEIAEKIGVDQSRVSQIIKKNDEIIFHNGDATDICVGASVDDINAESGDWGPPETASEILEPSPVETDASPKIDGRYIVCGKCGKKFRLVEKTLEGRITGHKILVEKCKKG